MGQVVIRDVPDDVIEAHRQRARARGLSLEQAGAARGNRGGGGLLGGRKARRRRMVAEFDAAKCARPC